MNLNVASQSLRPVFTRGSERSVWRSGHISPQLLPTLDLVFHIGNLFFPKGQNRETQTKNFYQCKIKFLKFPPCDNSLKQKSTWRSPPPSLHTFQSSDCDRSLAGQYASLQASPTNITLTVRMLSKTPQPFHTHPIQELPSPFGHSS